MIEHFVKVTDIVLRLGDRGYLSKLVYTSADPYAVELIIRDGVRVVSTWVFARDLLRRGVTEHAGEGDIRFWPQKDQPTRMSVRLISAKDGNSVTFTTARDLVQMFLKRTYEAVPDGEEFGPDAGAAVDAELAAMLQGEST